MLSIIGFSIITLIIGFFLAAVLQKTLHGLFRFRAEWNTTFIACTLIAFVCEFAFITAAAAFDSHSPDFLLKLTLATALISVITGTSACRLIIRSKSGRHLPTAMSALLAATLTAPPLFTGVMFQLFTTNI